MILYYVFYRIDVSDLLMGMVLKQSIFDWIDEEKHENTDIYTQRVLNECVWKSVSNQNTGSK